MVIKNISTGGEKNGLSQTRDLEEFFWITAKYLAQDAGMEFTYPCGTILKDFICAGVRNMLREKRTTEHDMDEAEHNFSVFVRAIIAEVRNNPEKARETGGIVLGKDPAVIAIREDAVVAAKHVCPLWPFC